MSSDLAGQSVTALPRPVVKATPGNYLSDPERQELHEVRELKMPKSLPGFCGGEKRSKVEGEIIEESEEEDENRQVERDLVN